MIHEDINQLIEEITRNYPQEDIFEARKEYQKVSGEVFEDDKSYESRVGCFLEWYTFDRPLPESNKTPIEEFLAERDESVSPEKVELAEAISQSIQGLFMTVKIKPDTITLVDIFDDTKYQIPETQGSILFNTDDIFEARLIPFKGQYCFTYHFCYHPKPTVGFIKTKVKNLKLLEESALKKEKQLLKDLASPQKTLAKVSAKIEKLNGKLATTTKENKLADLREKIAGLESETERSKNLISDLNRQLTELRTEVIQGTHRQNRFALMRKLSYMSLKWERSRQIDIQDIYHD